MKKAVKIVLPIAFLASAGLGLIACEQKPATPAKQTPPPSNPDAAKDAVKKEAEKK